VKKILHGEEGEFRDVVDLGLGEQDRMPAPGDLGESVVD